MRVAKILMKEIKTYEDLKNEFKKYKIIRRNTLRTRGYVNRIFECGCGKLHDVNEVKILMCALLVRFVFKCTKNISSMVKVSGFFKSNIGVQILAPLANLPGWIYSRLLSGP